VKDLLSRWTNNPNALLSLLIFSQQKSQLLPFKTFS